MTTTLDEHTTPGALILRPPAPGDAAAIHALVADCPPLDLNSVYAYLLLCHHFADTCVVAEDGQGIAGFISGYMPPGQPDTFFVWQVAVHQRARGQGLGARMLAHLLTVPATRTARYLDTTVSPSNAASRALFKALARRLDAPLNETMLFDRGLFGDAAAHEDEVLLRIGPFP